MWPRDVILSITIALERRTNVTSQQPMHRTCRWVTWRRRRAE